MDTLQVIQFIMTTMATKADLEALRAETKASRLPDRAPAEGVRPRLDQRTKVWDPVL